MMSAITVDTRNGLVTGSARDMVSAFYDIPYAGPMQGAARFGRPQPVLPWVGERSATRPGAGAPAPARDRIGPLDMTSVSGPPWTGGSGDFLTVNVWTPRTQGAALPVMVFLHGGGFIAGTGTATLYDGSTFARDGVVLVTLNYRLGIHGWLALPEAPANRGLLDVLAALEWVAENISSFGGDPRKVTLFGQSAGATIVSALLSGPAAGRLFQRAISQSGNGQGAFSPEQADRVNQRLGTTLEVPVTAAGLAHLPDAALVDAQTALRGLNLAIGGRPDPLLGLSPFAPVIDDELLPRQPADAVLRGAGESVDLMVGTNSDEANLYLVPTGQLSNTSPEQLYLTAHGAHPDPDALLAVYRQSRPEASDGELRAAVMGAALFRAGSYAMLDAHAVSTAGHTYSYEFAWRSDAFDGQLGASHTMELPFVFDRVDRPDLHGEQSLLGPGAPRGDLATYVHGAWVSFAKSGDPGWAPYHPQGGITMRLGDASTISDDGRSAERQVWRSR